MSEPKAEIKPIEARYQGRVYALYHTPTTDEQINEYFTNKYGAPPTEIIRTGGGVLAGPKPEGWQDAERQGYG